MNDGLDGELAGRLIHSETMRVHARHTVPEVEPNWPGFVDMPPVLATAMMIGFVEQTCIEALRPHLQPGLHTVGTHVNISHTGPTPVGVEVTANIELVEIERRKLTFRVRVSDEDGLIGEGVHERYIIDVAGFMARVEGRMRSG